ncbi:MAG: portal protein [Terriglobia bacterium]
MPENNADEKLLTEIRERFDYCQDQWADIREEAQTDMDYVSGNPWPAAERRQREDAGRPSLVMDELGQYINHLVNDVRQNKRAVKVIPRGFGAKDKIAELRENLIRDIEYRSNAQSAYATAFESMCQRSYGGWRITRRYTSDTSFDQEIRIARIPNPDASYPDPDCKESDFSDARYWFLLDLVPRKEYKKRWPNATIGDFNGDHIKIAPAWIKEDQIQVAEYWRVEHTERNLLQVTGPHGQALTMFEDEAPTGKPLKILAERVVQQRRVMQYVTNGVEILEQHEEPGRYIPIVWLVGKELYVSRDTGPKRMLMSFVRLARDPQMLVNYYRTCEAELVGMTPKTPWLGAVGQFHNPDQWQAANTTPVAYLEYKATTEATGQQQLPPPQRADFTPQIAPLEMGAESARRAVQAALGLSALPVNAQRFNDKSGVALEEIDANEDRGSFHFIDAYEMALEHSGRIINDLIKHVYDGPRDVGVRKQDGTASVARINQPAQSADGHEETLNIGEGEHDVTIATGPSFQSEREKADEFVELMVPQIEALSIDPGVKSKLLALLIKLKNIGPIGDEMAEMLAPPSAEQSLQAQLQQAQQQAQTYQTLVAQLQAENQKLYAEKNGKVVDNEYMLQKTRIDNDVKILIAEIEAKAQSASERAQMYKEFWIEQHSTAHDAASQAMEQAHEAAMAAARAQNAQVQQQQQAGQQPPAAIQAGTPGTNGAGG